MWNCKPFFLGLQEFIDKLNRKKNSFASSVQKNKLKAVEMSTNSCQKSKQMSKRNNGVL